jgi:broad specificity phosphatase PhoE
MEGTVHLVRHGEVENPKGVIYGRMPGFHLSERGRKQADAAAARLADRPIGAIWASPLERAQETATAIASRHPHLAVVTDDRLIESGTTVEGVGRTPLALLLSPRHWWAFRNPWGPSWGERFVDIKERTLAAIEEAHGTADGLETVIVSHQTPVLVARLALARRRVPPWLAFTPCGTGSITSLTLEDDRVLEAAYFAPPI